MPEQVVIARGAAGVVLPAAGEGDSAEKFWRPDYPHAFLDDSP